MTTHLYIDVPSCAPLPAYLAEGSTDDTPTTLIEMTLSCQNLINADVITKSDPYCVIHMKEPWQDKFFEIGRTEVIQDNLDPEWMKKFLINYNFEVVQKIRFVIWDQDVSGRDDLLGMFETTLAEIVSHSGNQFRGKLLHKNTNNAVHIIIVTEEVTTCKENILMQFSAKHLEKLCWYLRNDPFLVLYRSNEDGSCSVVARTEVAHSTQNPKWEPIITKARTLCNGDYERSIKIECYDSRANGSHKLIRTCHTCLNNLSKGPGENNQYVLRNLKKKNKTGNSGILELVNISIAEEVSFMDYIRGGTQLHFSVAIDFTASNKPSNDPHSLHYLSDHRPNNYEIALKSVGEIIAPYDSSRVKKYPAFGFGAKIPPSNEVSHKFPLNGNDMSPYCSSIDEIIQHYRNTVKKVHLFGPCNFAPVIDNTIAIAKKHQDGKHYFILLIVTDGIISDMKQTINSIIDAAKLPISIIIVGVGDADFTAMDELDADECRLSINGRTAERDIVQFVPLNQFITGQVVRSKADLAKEVLFEVPDQITGYMRSRGFKPTPNGQTSK